jgi:acylphosphatase
VTNKPLKRAHLHISGRVQGVNFRYYTRQQAESLGIHGWVRNLFDRRVEAIIEGDEISLQQMIDWCHHGPSAARVDQVEVQWEDATGEFSKFEIKRTFGW